MQPIHVPERKSTWLNDCPITEMGSIQAQLIGRDLYERKTHLDAVYVSPSLRCVQTANTILEKMLSKIKLNVEPALFEATCMYTVRKDGYGH